MAISFRDLFICTSETYYYSIFIISQTFETLPRFPFKFLFELKRKTTRSRFPTVKKVYY